MIKGNHINGKKSVLGKPRMKTKIRRAAILLAAIFAAPSLVLSPAFAATPKNTTANNSPNTLKVSPVRTDIEIPAGTSKKVDTYLTNLTDTPITVKPISNDFIAGDERGTPALILDADQFAPTHSLKKFMNTLPDTTIPAKQTKTISVTITVPKDAQAGGYFGAIRFAPTDPNGGGQVNLSASVASLILMTVPGPATEKLILSSFDIQQNAQTNSYFKTPDNLQVAFRMQNQGNIQQGPFGKVSVLKDGKVVQEEDFNIDTPREMVLPDSARRWEIPLKNIEKFGHYTVKGTFTYGSKNETLEVTKSFWVIPTTYIIGTIAAVVVLMLLITLIVWLIIRRVRGGGKMKMRRY